MKEKVIIILMSLLSAFAFVSEIEVNPSILLILSVSFSFFYNRYLYKYKNNPLFLILAVIFSLFMVIGASVKLSGGFFIHIKKSYNVTLMLVAVPGYAVFFNVLINLINDFFINYKITYNFKDSWLIKKFNDNPFKFTFITLLICYIPWIISYYPVVINPDAAKQIKEFMGLTTDYLDRVNLVDPNVMITNFNPVFHTFILGSFFKLGYHLGSVNFGLFLYAILQVSFVIFVFSYAINYMKKKKMNNVLIIITLLLYAFIPVYGSYTMAAVKDVFFASFIYLYIIKLYDYLRYDNSFKNLIKIVVLSIFVILFRNNGFHTIILSFPFLLFFTKKKIHVLTGILLILSFYQLHFNIVIPHFKITNTSVAESMSVFFQQTARLAKYRPHAFTEKDKDVIDKLIGFDTLKDRYEPHKADKVKDEINKNHTNEDLKSYLEVWKKGLYKYPDIYIDATLSNTYGYFYPNTYNWYLYNTYNTLLEEAGFDYHYSNIMTIPRQALKTYGDSFSKVPVLGAITNIAFNVWIIMIFSCLFIFSKKRELIIILLPSFAIVLASLVGPINTYFRYILPIAYTMPFYVTVVYHELNKRNKL